MKIHNPANDNGEAVGIGFGLSDNLGNVGAAIIHDRVGTESQGGLHFATKGSASALGDIPIRLSINSAGNVGIGTSSPTFTSAYGGLHIHSTYPELHLTRNR